MDKLNSQCDLVIRQRIAIIKDDDGGEVRLFYLDVVQTEVEGNERPTILLIHGFPQTSHQYRKVLAPLASAGYRLIVPDYRGAGLSPPPTHSRDYRKSTLARDLQQLIKENLNISDPIYIVGHDLGGMIAHAYASRYPRDVKAVIWGECPLPGTSIYERDIRNPAQFHFLFHRQLDLADHLVRGNERLYVQHFLNKQTINAEALSEEDVEHYTRMYSLMGRMRAGMSLYEAFEVDKKENLQQLELHGKCKVPALGLNGANSQHQADGEPMMTEMYHNSTTAHIDQAGHYVAEENPKGFVENVLKFFNSIRDKE